jgi:flavodoxin
METKQVLVLVAIVAVIVVAALALTMANSGNDSPDTPVTPDEPETPTDPVTPDDPVTPVDPDPVTPTDPETPTDPDDGKLTGKSIVIVFSVTENTYNVATEISDYLEVPLYRILPEVPYTAEDIVFGDEASRAYKERHDDSARPAIQGDKIDLSDYDIIILGYPIWYKWAPKIIYTFLDEYDLSGKTIVTFCTSNNTGIYTSLAGIKPLEPNATWIAGVNFSASSTTDEIVEWLKSVGLEKSQ